MDGSLVKVNCLAGAPSKLQKATLKAASAAAAAANDLRAASAATMTTSDLASTLAASVRSVSDSNGGAQPHASAPVVNGPAAGAHASPAGATAAQSPPQQQSPQLPLPGVLVKEEVYHTEQPVGVVGVAAKRPGDAPSGGAVAMPPEAKRVKLEVQ